MKQCKKCGTMFDTLNCNVCARARVARWRAENPEWAKENSRNWYLENKERALATQAKYRDENLAKILVRQKNAYQKNKQHYIEKVSEYQRANPEKRNKWYRKAKLLHGDKINERSRIARRKDIEKTRADARAYYAANKKRILAGAARREKLNLGKARAKCAKRRAAKLMAIPTWADSKAIAIVYEKAREWGFQVDHIVPLQSKVVCGLHCEANLQLMHISENSKKHNKTWPDMPSEQYLLAETQRLVAEQREVAGD